MITNALRFASRWWNGTSKGQELDKVRASEIGDAVRMLRGVRHARRKRQRMRQHVTYRQRDAIAWLLIRLQHERKEQQTMNRQDWTDQFIEYLTGLSEYPLDDIEAAADTAAEEQQDATATDDAGLWQNPAAAANEVLNQWNREAEEAAEAAMEPPPEAEPYTSPQWVPPADTQDAPTEPAYPVQPKP